jgi:hypothetical protein
VECRMCECAKSMRVWMGVRVKCVCVVTLGVCRGLRWWVSV